MARLLSNPLVIVDSTYLMHRGFHAVSLSTSDGVGVGAVFNFLKTVKHVSERFGSTDFIFGWDGAKAGERRKELHPDYKAHRAEKRKEHKNLEVEYQSIQDQMKMTREILDGFTRPSIRVSHLEADDIIYLAAKWARETDPHRPVVIVTNDKDMFQLVSKRVSIYRPIEQQTMTHEDFGVHTGVEDPAKWVLYRVCTGDSSDNIPGVKGIGDVWAKKLVNACPGTTVADMLQWATQTLTNGEELAALGSGAARILNLFVADPEARQFTYKLMRISATLKRSDLTAFERALEDQLDKEFNFKNFINRMSKLEFNSIINDALFWRKFNNTPLSWAN